MADLEQLTVGTVFDLIHLRYKDAKRSEQDAHDAKNPPARMATQADIDKYL